MSDVSSRCGISGLSFDSTLLSLLLFFCLLPLLFLSCLVSASLTKNVEEFSGKESGEWGQYAGGKKRKKKEKKDRTERAKGMGTEKRDSKVQSNDSPEIQDIGETSDIPGLPLEQVGWKI